MDIKVRNLEKKYGENLIINIDRLDIKRNRINMIIGKNGSGKTTFLNIIAGLDNEYSGHMLYNKNKINKKIMRDITLVSQKPYMLNRSVLENISYPLKIRKYKKDDIIYRIESIIEKLDIGKLKNRNATTLSGGEKQKVAIARAMVFQPKVLLLDEITSNIDNSSKIDIEEIIIEYRENYESNIILVSHEIRQIEKLGENIIKLD